MNEHNAPPSVPTALDASELYDEMAGAELVLAAALCAALRTEQNLRRPGSRPTSMATPYPMNGPSIVSPRLRDSVRLRSVKHPGQEFYGYLSISPITMSREPTTAGMSARRKPSQSGAVGARLQKQELLARARSGFTSPLPTK
jgi:hypothetical protein